jgi:3-oxoacyl-[acyl-carrier-protein] synthase-1
MTTIPVHSLKGNYGHTLGAAGLVESVIAVESLIDDVVFPTKGYVDHGVTDPINICSEIQHTKMNYVLKTASGFGGCNAAMVFGKES